MRKNQLQERLTETRNRNGLLEDRNKELFEITKELRSHTRNLEAQLAASQEELKKAKLAPEPAYGTVLIQTDEHGVPLPYGAVFHREDAESPRGWVLTGRAEAMAWYDVVEHAPLKIIYAPAEAPADAEIIEEVEA